MPPSPEGNKNPVQVLEKRKSCVVLVIWITVAFILLQPLLVKRLPDASAILVSGLGSLMLVLGIPVELFFWNRLRKRVRLEKEIELATRPHKDRPEHGEERSAKRPPVPRG